MRKLKPLKKWRSFVKLVHEYNPLWRACTMNFRKKIWHYGWLLLFSLLSTIYSSQAHAGNYAAEFLKIGVTILTSILVDRHDSISPVSQFPLLLGRHRGALLDSAPIGRFHRIVRMWAHPGLRSAIPDAVPQSSRHLAAAPERCPPGLSLAYPR